MSVLDTFRLDGRVAIVTGVSSGGFAFAQAFAEAWRGRRARGATRRQAGGHSRIGSRERTPRSRCGDGYR